MASVNKTILIGHLGADPELKYTAGGVAVCNFSIATSEKWNDKDGQHQEKTEWHRVVLWNRLAEIAKEYLKKGSQVYVEGKLQTRSYEDKDGIKRYITEIVGHQLQFLGGKPGDADKSEQSGPASNNQPEDDDLPF